MPAAERKLFNYLDTGILTLNAVVAGTTTGGPTLDMRLVEPGTLSALVCVDAETNTLTIEVFWEVSNTGLVWYEVVSYDNAPLVVWATGTAGADASVQRVIAAPAQVVDSFRYVRCSVRNRVANGTVNDTYQIGYNCTKPEWTA